MARSAKRQRRLSDGYSFVGFRANATVRGVFGDPDVRIVRLDRRSKKRFAAVVGGSTMAGTIDGCGRFATCRLDPKKSRNAPGAGGSIRKKRQARLASAVSKQMRLAGF